MTKMNWHQYSRQRLERLSSKKVSEHWLDLGVVGKGGLFGKFLSGAHAFNKVYSCARSGFAAAKESCPRA